MESLQYSVILYTDAIWNALKWNFEMWYNIGYKVSWKPFVIFFFLQKNTTHTVMVACSESNEDNAKCMNKETFIKHQEYEKHTTL